MGTENEDLEKDYDDAFDEASGEGEGASDEDKDFASGDDESAGEEPAADAEKDEAGAEPGGEEEPAEAAASDAEPAGDEEDPSDEPSGEAGAEGEGAAASDEPKKPEAPKYDEETIRRAAELLKKTQQPEADAAPEAKDEEPPKEKTWLDFVPEDKRAIVDKYEQEWAEVSEAEQIKRTAELQLLQDRLYSDLKSALAPVFETTQRLQVNAHFDTIRQQHPDFDNIRDQLSEWIDQQPEFVRPAYQEVAEKGSPQQIIDMINQFKAAKGMTGAVPEVPASSARKPEQRKPAQKQPAASAKKALAAAPSPSKAEVPGSARHDDFDDAFEEAAGGI